MPIITPGDLEPFAPGIDPAKAAAMIEDAMADASRIAPCITDPDLTPERAAQFKSLLRAALLRWHDSGSGAYQQQTAGPFSVGLDTRQQRRGMFWPSEIEAMQDICRDDAAADDQAFMVDMIAPSAVGDPYYWRPDLRFQYEWPDGY